MVHHSCPLRDRDSLAGEWEVKAKTGGDQLDPRPSLPTHFPQ